MNDYDLPDHSGEAYFGQNLQVRSDVEYDYENQLPRSWLCREIPLCSNKRISEQNHSYYQSQIKELFPECFVRESLLVQDKGRKFEMFCASHILCADPSCCQSL